MNTRNQFRDRHVIELLQAVVAASAPYFEQLRRIALWFVALSVVGGWSAPGVQAADKYQAGEEIEVFFLNKWWPGVVVEVGRRGEVLAEFEFAAAQKRQVFPAAQVRGAFEAGALLPAKLWSDMSGKFKIRAALIAVDKDSITLRKPDKTEITVPIDKLSQSDQDLLKKFKKEAAVTVGPAPPILEEFALDSALDPSSLWSTTANVALEPDPMPAYLKMQQGGVAFAMQDFFDQLGAVLPLGGPDAWILAGVENGTPGAPKPSRILWVSLAKKKIVSQQLLPPGEIVMDYHPGSKQLLTYSQVTSEGDSRGVPALTLWRTLPAEEQATPIVRWMAGTAETNRTGVDPWARIVDANTVLQRTKRQEFSAWDVASKRLKYRLNQEAFFAPAPTLSGGRRYLAFPEDKGLRVIEAATGKLLAYFASANGVAGASFTEDGRRLAFIGRNQLQVCDLTAPQAVPEEFQAEAIGTPFQTTLEWVDSDRLMADALGGHNKVLFSLKHRLPLWNYEFDWNAVRDEPGRRFRHIVDGHLVYAATVREGANKGLAVGAVKLPGPKVDESDAALDPDSLLIIKRGTAMKANIQCGAFNERVWAAVQKVMATNGWTYDANAPITLVAEMKQGEASQVTYHQFGGGTQTATITPFVSSLRLDVGGESAWVGGTSSGAPPVLRLGEGKSVQDEVNKWQNADPEFFERVTVPEKIIDPKKRQGLGTTQVTNRGLIPK